MGGELHVTEKQSEQIINRKLHYLSLKSIELNDKAPVKKQQTILLKNTLIAFFISFIVHFGSRICFILFIV